MKQKKKAQNQLCWLPTHEVDSSKTNKAQASCERGGGKTKEISMKNIGVKVLITMKTPPPPTLMMKTRSLARSSGDARESSVSSKTRSITAHVSGPL